MVTGFRPKLGMNLQNIVAGDQLPFPGSQVPGELGFPQMTPGQGMGEPKPKGGFFREGGMGRTIAGLIGDALLQQADMAPVYAPAMRQRQAAEAEEAQWTRRREADNQDWQSREQWKLANQKPEVPAMLRNVQAWQQMTPEQRKAYQEMNDADRGPFTVLPNGQVWARDPALMAQLGGGTAPAQPQVIGSELPPGWKVEGGPQARPAGTFRP